MKNSKKPVNKPSNKSPRKEPFSKEQEILKVPASVKPKSKKIIFWAIGGGLLAAIMLVAIGWFLGQHTDRFDPYQALKSSESNRHEFIVKSSEVSVKMAQRAVKALKEKRVKEAIKDCEIAIDIFPIDAKPYILLTEYYLMTGQEQKMYDTLTLAGRSYPNFNNIVSVIDDANLDKMPLDEPSDNIYLANFPENKKMAMSYMFDDGEADVYKALPTFEKYGFRATIPVVAGYVADKSGDPFWGSWEEWKDADNRGFEIANHSMYHRDAKKLHGDDFDTCMDQARDIIEQSTGHKVMSFVFPHDSYTDEAVSRALRLHKVIRTKEFLQSYYKRTVDIVLGGPNVSLKTANRLVDIGIKRRLWLIAKCHGVTEKRSMRSFKSITPEFLDKNLAYIHSKADDVWVDTFYNVFSYLSLRTKTKINIKDFSAASAEFVVHADTSDKQLSNPLTVVLNIPAGAKVSLVQAADGHVLKSWSCAADKWCVDVDSNDEDIHVQWGNDSN